MNVKASVHPFPARMAPELVTERLQSAAPGQVFLDPMMGSGSFVIAAARAGHRSIGVDSDPLTHILAEAAYGKYSESDFLTEVDCVLQRAGALDAAQFVVDSETSDYIDFWFDPDTRSKLSKLAMAIRESPSCLQAPLWCAFSRLIITKDAGASRARDVSHSRPHRARDAASFDVIEMYPRAARTVVRRAGKTVGENVGSLTLIRGDSRRIPIADRSIDGIMTSPPYLIAIDYLRGHRMSLVWMGYSIKELRQLRSENVGSSRGAELDKSQLWIAERALQGELQQRLRKIVNRYILDVSMLLDEISRVVRPGGDATFVVANSRHSGASVSVEAIFVALATDRGLELRSQRSRLLPSSSRYLPPPKATDGSLGAAIERRMSSEVILTFTRQ